ncbi:NAD(P)-binding protein [Cadophora sp. DSE1049]|nr:NAD(P)-binding protein [Cadophora sp. DSE1049]
MSEIRDDIPRSPKVWLVTGCSTGFGRSIVQAIIAHGDKVIATARKTSDLTYIGSTPNARALQLDVTAEDHFIQQKIEEAIAAFGRIDVLVNNAGYVLSGVWEEVSSGDTMQQFETNVFGALKMTRGVLPHMRARRSGIILFMSSISGWHGVGAGGPYSSSKFALEGAVECLQKETAHLGIRTHLLVIGQFRTNILNPNKKNDSLERSEIAEYDAIKQELAERHKITDGKQPGNPELAAERILDIARGENFTSHQLLNLPLRIPLGSDAIDVMRRKCKETLAAIENWDDFARSTDFPEVGDSVPDYFQK